MRRNLLLAVALLVSMLGMAQIPQFSAEEFDDWEYNNPGVALSASNILGGKIALYVTSTGVPLTLTSPPFACHRGETIDMAVKWLTPQWQNPGFQLSRVALTAALLDESGHTVDSVTCIPSTASRTNNLTLSLSVSRNIGHARLRFVAWKSIVSNCGMIEKIQIACANKADVNGDGEVSIGDINAIIGVILGLDDDAELKKKADVNDDGEVTVPDVNYVIDVILG